MYNNDPRSKRSENKLHLITLLKIASMILVTTIAFDTISVLKIYHNHVFLKLTQVSIPITPFSIYCRSLYVKPIPLKPHTRFKLNSTFQKHPDHAFFG